MLSCWYNVRYHKQHCPLLSLSGAFVIDNFSCACHLPVFLLHSCLTEKFFAVLENKHTQKAERRDRVNLRRDRTHTKWDRRKKWRSEQRNKSGKLRTKKHKQLFGMITYSLPIEPEIKQLFYSHCFFCLKKQLLLNNKLHLESLQPAGLERTKFSVAISCTENVNIKHCICPETALNQRSEIRRQQQIPKCWMFISSQTSFNLFQARLSGQCVTFLSTSTQLQRFHLPLKYHFYNAKLLYLMISTAQIMKNYLKNGCLITSEQAVLFWKRN